MRRERLKQLRFREKREAKFGEIGEITGVFDEMNRNNGAAISYVDVKCGMATALARSIVDSCAE